MKIADKNIISLISEAKKQGVDILVENEKLVMRMPKGYQVPQMLLNELKLRKEELWHVMQSGLIPSKEVSTAAVPKIKAGATKERGPLSSAQKRLWFINRMEQGVNYHIPVVMEVKGELDIDALENAFKKLLHRHEILRTTYLEVEGMPFQTVQSEAAWQLRRFSLQAADEQALQDLIHGEIHHPFDLSSDYLLRTGVYSQAKESHTVITVVHHIAADGWSMPILMSDLAAFYREGISFASDLLEPLPIQYIDFAVWQNERLHHMEDALAYWTKHLDGYQPLQLPTDFKRPAEVSRRGKTLHFEVPPTLVQSVKEFSNKRDVTFFMTLLSTFKILLNKYTGQEDICVGCGIANRTQSELEKLVGFFVNTLAIRNRLEGNPSFTRILDDVKKTTLDAFQHQEVPFEAVVERVAKDRDISRDSVIQVLFMVQNTPQEQEPNWGPLAVKELPFDYETSKFDLTLHVYDKADTVTLAFEYCTDLFTSATITRLKDHFLTILSSVIETPDTVLGDIQMIGGEERQKVLYTFNESLHIDEANDSLINLFEAQVANHPHHVAVSFEGQSYTYTALHEKVLLLAARLTVAGVQAGDVIAICSPRSVEMIVALLAVFKVGGAYLPIDLAYPNGRIEEIFRESAVKWALADDSFADRFALEGVHTINIEKALAEPIADHKNIQHPQSLGGTAYVIYTSGSTGKPKGVAMPQSALVNLLQWQQQCFDNEAGRVVLQFTSLGFDVSFQEIFSTLCYGNTLVLIEEERRKDPYQVLQVINEHLVTHLFLPFIVLDTLAEAAVEHGCFPASLQAIITAGEQLRLTKNLTHFVKQVGATLINQYGPSESHVVSSYTVTEQDLQHFFLPPIGKPISNTRLYILDAYNKPCGVGIPGELYIAGKALATGYYQRQDLTEQRFFNLLIDGRPTLVYKTGDLVKWLPDGNITYIGRNDDQVKIRGNRVELGEVEAVIMKCAGVTACTVLVKKDKADNNYLAAYLVKENSLTREQLETAIRATLPVYMVPSAYVFLDKMPVNANGKVNKRLLPEPIFESAASLYAPPSTPEEVKMAAVWCDLLKLEKVGLHDNFFTLGGHSLLATRLVWAIRTTFKTDVPLKAIFRNATLAELVAYVSTMAGGEKPVALLTIKDKPSQLPLSFSQERLWFLDKFQGSTNYHIWNVWDIKGPINEVSLAKAIKAIVDRHEVLRTVFVEEGDTVYQKINTAAAWKLDATVLEVWPSEADLRQLIHETVAQPFDLQQDYMLRARLITLSADSHILVFVWHHIATDGWSAPIFLNELKQAYEAVEKGLPIRLPALAAQYSDYALWQQSTVHAALFAAKVDYWEDKLKGVPPLNFPKDYQVQQGTKRAGKMYSHVLPAVLKQQVQQLSEANGATSFMVYLAAFHVLLYRYTGQADTCIGVPVSNRGYTEFEALIGFFVNNLPMRCQLTGEMSFEAVVAQVKATALEAYEHQDVPFEKMVERLVHNRDMGQNPIFQVTFTYHNHVVPDHFELANASAVQVPLEIHFTLFELSFHITETDKGVTLAINYSTDVFKDDTIQRLAANFERLLAGLVGDVKLAIGVQQLLSESETASLLKVAQGAYWDGGNANFMTLFAQVVRAYPHAKAITEGDKTVTYQELNAKAAQVAGFLTAKGWVQGELVAICMPRSLEKLVAMLGIWKAGGAYLPIDPSYPTGRIDFIIENAGVSKAIVATQFNRDELILESPVPEREGLLQIHLDELEAVMTGEDAPVIIPSTKADDLAYVIYTSGSTGLPKGVKISHAALNNLIQWHQQAYTVATNAKASVLAGVGFDASVWEVWPYLASGATVSLVLEETKMDPLQLLQWYNANGITHTFVPTALLPSVVAASKEMPCASLQCVLTGGDALHAIDLANVPYKIYNNYGPTENTVVASYYELTGNEIGNPPIGKPIANTTIYLLDRNHQLVPYGAIGEICISGLSLAAGYLNNATLTAEKFQTITVHDTAQYYKTGDLARWLPDGNLEFLGRVDDQVQIRGYRIELGEITYHLNHYPGITQSFVTTFTNQAGVQALVAYVCCNQALVEKDIRDGLKRVLPGYMVPETIVMLDAFPLSPNGKLDKEALPLPTVEVHEFTAPRNEIETQLFLIWKELLNTDKIGIHDDFFALGGDSIITIQVVSRAKRLGYSLQARDIFEHKTIAALAAVITQTDVLAEQEQGKLTGTVPFTPIQQWFLGHVNEDIHHYNQALLFKIDKSISAAKLQQAVQQLTDHHDSLRLRYSRVNGIWQQTYADATTTLQVANILGARPEQVNDRITEACNQYQRGLHIETGPIFCPVLILMPDTDAHNRLFMCIHHLAVDGVSWRIIIDDLKEILVHEEVVDLGKKGTSYRAFAEALADFAKGEVAMQQFPFWKAQLANQQPLPVDKKGDASLWGDVKDCRAVLSKNLTQKLLTEVNGAFNTTANDMLLAAFLFTIKNWSGNNWLTIGMEGHGREDIGPNLETGNTVGWFTNIYPLSIEFGAEDDIVQAIKLVKEKIRLIPGKGMAYGALNFLHPSQDVRSQLVADWEILFNYLGQFDSAMGSDGVLSLATESAGQGFGDRIPFNNRFMINCLVTDGALDITWSYSDKDYHRETIENLLTDYIQNIQLLVDYCAGKANLLTPSDCGLAGKVSIESFDQFLNTQVDGIPRKELVSAVYPLSPMQEGMLFHGLFDKSSTAYMEQVVCDVNTAVNLDVFTKTWVLLVQNHSVLRTAFHHNDLAVPVQCDYKHVQMPLTYLDFSGYDPVSQQLQLEAVIAADKAKGFDFTVAPLSRVTLIKLGQELYKMIWTHHHILLDGWSFSILTGKLLSYYEQILAGDFPQEAFKDDYRSLINLLENKNQYAEERFWREYAADFTVSTLLPFTDADVKDRNKDKGQVKELEFTFDRVSTNKITEYCRNLGITVNTLIQGVWARLLASYTANDVVAFGVTTSGRPAEIPFADKRVGLYINTIPLFANAGFNQKTGEWLKDLQKGHIHAREYQYTPLNSIQNWTSITGELFDTLLVFENYPVNENNKKQWTLQLGELQLEEHTNYLLTVIAYMLDELHVKFSYNADLLDRLYVERIRLHFEQVLLQITGIAKVKEQGYLSNEEKNILEQYGRGPTADYGTVTVVDRITANVMAQPTATALISEGQMVTYGSLGAASDRLAHVLQDKGLQKGEGVALYLDRSIDYVVAALAVLKMGAIYMPIDIAYPAERARYMLHDSGTALLISTSDKAALVQTTFVDTELCVVFADELYSAEPIDSIAKWEKPCANDVAYIIYTSGSSGQPKGVKVSHGSLNNLVSWHIDTFEVGAASRATLMASVAFDASVWELWPYLSGGAALCLVTDEVKLDPALLLQYFKEMEITHAFLITALVLPFLAQARYEELRLQYLLIGGERLSKVDLTGIGFKLINNYGPTENTVVATWYTVSGKENQYPPIGRPITNTYVRILDKSLQLVTPGGIGEICLSGSSLSNGYLNQDLLNQQKFVRCDAANGGSAIVYRTGDLGRWLPNGNIAFLGRMDQQVKFRGYRIEPGEIEHALLQQLGVRACFVTVLATSEDSKQMVGFVVVQSGTDTQGILVALQRYLPAHMIPNLLIEVVTIPLTVTGKVDVAQLKSLAVDAYLKKSITPPRNPMEHSLVAIWKVLLSNEMIGITDDFFSLGGNSLLVIRMIAAIKQEMGIVLSVKSVFQYPRILDLAAFILVTHKQAQTKQHDNVHIFEL